MAAIVALQLIPYGNTNYNSATGVFTCQHGTGECQSDTYELCVEYLLSGDLNSIITGDTSFAAWPFILCMEQNEGDPTKAQACYESTMDTTALPWATVQKCYDNDFNTVQYQAYLATVPLNHTYVPWVVVNNVLLNNQNLLQKAVCDAYTGPSPPSCKSLVEKETQLCFKN